MCYMVRMGGLANLKIVLKSGLRKVPGVGWCIQLLNFCFLDRDRSKDTRTLEEFLVYQGRTGRPLRLLLFPEGTDLTANTLSRSNAFAAKSGLPSYEYCLHPRTKGFAHTILVARKVCKFDAVLDVTVGYVGTIPQSEKDFISCNLSDEIHFSTKRFEMKHLPDTERELDEWCRERWAEKEQTLKEFYANKKFGDERYFDLRMDRVRTYGTAILYLAAMGWLMERFLNGHWCIASSLAAAVAACIYGTHFGGGMDSIIRRLF